MPPRAALQLALPLPLPQTFDYAPPAGHRIDAGDIGRRVRVPFGHRELVGIVAGIGQAEEGDALRDAIAFLDSGPLLEGELLQSLRWLARYQHAPLGEVLATALPAALRRGDPLPETGRHGWTLNEAGRTARPAMRTGLAENNLYE